MTSIERIALTAHQLATQLQRTTDLGYLVFGASAAAHPANAIFSTNLIRVPTDLSNSAVPMAPTS